MSVNAIVDEIAAVLEASSAKRDGTAARPVEYAADVLYAWPQSEKFTAADTGQHDQESFAIRVAWAVDESNEIAEGIRSRAVSDAITAKVAAYAAAIETHRAGSTFEWVQVDQVDYEALITHSVRGFLMDLSGYHYGG